MKKTYVAAIAILAALLIVLAAAIALYQLPSQTNTSTNTSSGTITATSSSTSQGGSGQLAVMGTDPAVTASGVSDAQVAYSSVMAHEAGTDMSSGWVQVSGSGSMDLMASQGTAQILATSQVNAGAYDAFRFNVDSVKVIYNGTTYAATVASSTLTAQSQSKVQVNASSKAAAVVDLRTFIENTASSSNPQFVFSATAVATDVPSDTLLSVSLQVGGNIDFGAQAWWNTFVAQTSTNLSMRATLSSNTLKLTLQNSGRAQAEIQEIIVTPVSTSTQLSASLPSDLSGSAIFTVNSAGSLQQASSIQASALLNGGVEVASGASSTLSYTGNITTNILATGIVPGQEYVVTCVGANTFASTTVVAS